MRLMVLVTADQASVDPSTAKINILGIFSRILAAEFPHFHQRLALVLKLRPDWDDHADERKLAIEMRDEDGTRYMRVEGSFRFPHGPGGSRPEFQAVLELNGLQFPHEGGYEFEVYADGELVGRTPIDVGVPQPPQE